MDYTSLNRIGLCTKKPLKEAKMSGYHTQTAAHNPEAGDSRSSRTTKKYIRDMRCLFMLDTQTGPRCNGSAALFCVSDIKNTPRYAVYFSGAVGGIRTLVPLLTTTRFPVVLVMTSSIPLHIHFSEEHSNDNYTTDSAFVKSGHQKI